jgi:hypothetical protein
MNPYDTAFYSEEELNNFLAEYNKPENWERLALPGLPSYYDIARALRQLDNIKGALEEVDYS